MFSGEIADKDSYVILVQLPLINTKIRVSFSDTEADAACPFLMQLHFNIIHISAVYPFMCALYSLMT